MLDANGKYLSTIRLEEAWGYKPRYPSWIAGDPKGGFVIEDYRGKSPAVLMGLEADVRTAFVRSSFADGRPADLRLFRVDSAGKLWGTDGSCIARVTPAGLVDEVLGSPPSPGTLETFTAACMDVKGNLYCVDARSGSVHVFDSAGKAVRVSKPDPTDFESRLVSSHVTASGDGAVSLRGGPSLDLRDPEYVLFGSSGERTGRKRVPLGEFRQDWYSQPSTGRTWVVSYRALFLLDASGKPVREIRKQPDGRWIEGTGNACVAPDGSLAVLSQPSGMLQVVNLYSAEGEPLRTIPVPRHSSHGSLAWDGRRVVLAWRDEAALMDPGGGPARRLRFDGGGIDKGADYWCFLPRHTPDELWILESKSRGIRRLGLP
jgi:hypothetical protein